MSTTTEHETSWPYIAGRMQVFAELLIQLDNRTDEPEELRQRLNLYAGMAREALAELDPAALAELQQRDMAGRPA